jgi:leader peptidase (prepilin peptidase) / N-methyltransferase
MVILFLVFASLFGLACGSFANVLIYRLPRDLSIVSPPSHCPSCDRELRFYHNIPLFSYIFLGGRCAFCKTRISARYPLVEAFVGVLFWFSAYNFAPAFPPEAKTVLALISSWVFLLFITALMFIDLEHFLLPDKLTLPGIFIGLASSFILPWTSPLESLIGAALGALVPSVLIGIYALRKIDAMGWGDVKLLAMIGAFLGWRGALLTLLIGALLGTIVGGIYIISCGKDKRTQLPFGTFLGIASFVALFWGDIFWNWYMEFSGGFP